MTIKKVFPVTVYSKPEKDVFENAISNGICKRVNWTDINDNKCEGRLAIDRFSNLVYKIYVNDVYKKEVSTSVLMDSLEYGKIPYDTNNPLTKDDYKYV